MGAVVYPRGFLGFDIGLPQTGDEVKNFLTLARNIQFNRPQDLSKPYISNDTIDLLWKKYTSGEVFTTSFAFREQILSAALVAFGTDSFHQWCELQMRSSYFSTMHKKFLNDTFLFIGGSKRSVTVSAWGTLLTAEGTTKTTPTEFDIKEFFGLNRPVGQQRYITLQDTLIAWTSQEGGYDDLLATLVIFFGSVV